MRYIQKGSILITVMALLLALSIMVAGFHACMFLRIQLYMNRINSIKAYYVAYSGLLYGRSVAGWDEYYSFPSIILEDVPGHSITETHTLVPVTGWRFFAEEDYNNPNYRFTLKATLLDGDILEFESVGKANGVEQRLVSREEVDMESKRFGRLIWVNREHNKYVNVQYRRIEWPVIK